VASVVRVTDRVAATVGRIFRERCGAEDRVEFDVCLTAVEGEEGSAVMLVLWSALDCPETEALSTSLVLLNLNHTLMHPEFLEESVQEIWDSLAAHRMVHAANLDGDAEG
jgi:hypothetical protein